MQAGSGSIVISGELKGRCGHLTGTPGAERGRDGEPVNCFIISYIIGLFGGYGGGNEAVRDQAGAMARLERTFPVTWLCGIGREQGAKLGSIPSPKTVRRGR